LIFDPVIPVPWIIAIAAVVLGVGAWHQFRSARHLGAGRNGFLIVTRLAALAAIVFLLLQPSREEEVPVPAREKSVLFAVDTSASMAEPHRDGTSRIDAARADLDAAGVLHENGGLHRFYTLATTAAPATPDAVRLAPADGADTRFDTSIAALLRMAGQPQPAALFLFSDGHDFDLVPPGDTARRARARDIPIFTIPYGTLESARDVSVRIANYHPHTFVRQRTRLEIFVRSFGTPHETLAIELLCDGQPVQRQTLETGVASFHTAHFDVTHEEPGSFEYTFRIAPVAGERELSNNSATTYLNVISERIRILEIEGKPFWDSTFLRRSFARNDKFDIDSLVAFTDRRVRPIRSNPERSEDDLNPPKSVDDLLPYNLVVFGRDVDRVIGIDGIRAVETWVRDHGGILVFSRGRAWSESAGVAAELTPIDWDTGSARGTRLEVTPQAGSVPAFRLLREVAAVDEFPEIISFPATSEPKLLATTFSVDDSQAPAIVYRRHGSGQTMSLGVGNLWRWVFNPRAEYDNNAYDRFWDQLALWLLANGGVAPLEGYNLRADTSNLPLGESIRLSFAAHGAERPEPMPPLVITRDGEPVTTLNFTLGDDATSASAELTPNSPGRYQATVALPDGKSVKTQFIVFRENTETTETAMDAGYLDQLARASGGRMIDASEIGGLVADLLRDSHEQDPLVRQVPLWDKPWVFLLLCFCLALDWFYRRKWGLV
jgi:hypothetical protein